MNIILFSVCKYSCLLMGCIYSSLFEQGAEWLLKAAPCPPAQLNALWLNEGSDDENTAILEDACWKALKEYVSRREELPTSVFAVAH